MLLCHPLGCRHSRTVCLPRFVLHDELSCHPHKDDDGMQTIHMLDSNNSYNVCSFSSSSSVQYYYSNGSRCNKFEGFSIPVYVTIILLLPPLQDSQIKLANILHPCRTSSTTADGSSGGGWRQTGAPKQERTNWKIMPQWIRCRYKRIYCWHFHPWPVTSSYVRWYMLPRRKAEQQETCQFQEMLGKSSNKSRVKV